MLKVCGITFEHSPNYGSCLQAYALQTAIINMHFGKNELCNYKLIPIQKMREYPMGNGGISSKIACSLVEHFFERFRKKYMIYVQIERLEDLNRLNDIYDVFVCGSDVIWNPDFNHNFGAFFLDFADKYAFSYAASFGKAELSRDYLASLKQKLSHLRSISERESSGIKVISENTGRSAVQVADPVLLLKTKDWDRIADIPKSKGDYIFVYTTHTNATVEQFIRKMEKQTGLRIIRAVCGPKQALKYRIYPQSPERWIGWIKNAKYVVTNSFHCTAFCTMYHKDYYTVVHGPADGGINIRMNEFLESMGLNDRIYNYVPESIDLSSPDFTKADETIQSLRDKSLQFLQENLEKAYEEKCRTVSPEKR